MNIQYFIALLLVLNIVLVNSDLLVKLYYWSYKKLFNPKYNEGDYVIGMGELLEIVYVLEHEPPYTYFCLPLNKNTVIIQYHYRQKELKPASDLINVLR